MAIFLIEKQSEAFTLSRRNVFSGFYGVRDMIGAVGHCGLLSGMRVL